MKLGHASAVLAASIFHFGESTIAQARARLKLAGIDVPEATPPRQMAARLAERFGADARAPQEWLQEGSGGAL